MAQYSPSSIDDCERLRRRAMAAERLLKMHFESGIGHIGGNLSALDIMLATYHDAMTKDDQFILSKGHSAGALYITLWTVGRLAETDLEQFHRDNTLLSGHPPARNIDDILFATGSLGHGFGLAAGVALAKRFLGEPGRVFCLTSDGEWNEGSTWESLIFSRHQKLNNLTVVVDENGLQGFGSTRDVADISPLADKLRTFGLTTFEINGHDPIALKNALQTRSDEGPLMIVAKTIKGHGVSFMEHQFEWHYLPLTADQYKMACREVSGA